MNATEADDQALEWVTVCSSAHVPEQSGVAALLPGKRQAAVFRANDELYALSNMDPFSHAAVLARGIVGDVDGIPIVTSPLHKHRFDLRSGQCLDAEDVVLASYPLKVTDGVIYLGVAPR